MIRVMVAEDSPASRDLLIHVLESDPEIRVVGSAVNGEDAVEAARRLKPDVVMMDVHMPKMNGFEATRSIMATRPVPIVIVSGTLDEADAAFASLEAGALAFVRHPPGPGHPNHGAAAAELLRTVRLMAEVRLVRRWTRREPGAAPRGSGRAAINIVPREIRLIAIGASTGGPVVLQHILSAVAKDLNAPALVVQHISPGFTQGFAEWLGKTCGLPAHVAADGEPALPGHVYIAPEDAHMGIRGNGRIALSAGAAEHGVCPSISYLFRSVAEALGSRAVGILLTGMGRDGAQELKLMKEKGAVTIVQDEQSSIVHGMAGEAMRLDAATHVLSPEEIAAALSWLLKRDAPGP